MNRFWKIADGLRTNWTERIARAVTGAIDVALSTGLIAALIYLLVALGPLMSSPSAYSQAAPPPAGVQFQAGIEKENVDGDLKAAMSIYEKIAADTTVSRDMRSKALLRLAGCEEKLGKQARQLYEQIVREYSDQPAAAQARTRLAAIRQQEHPASPETMTVRRIEREKLGNFGPGDTDGNRATYIGPDGKLYFGDVSGHSKSLVFADPEFRRAPAWEVSRDLSLVALMLPKTKARPVTLAVIKMDGTGYREVLRDDEQGNILGGDNGFYVRWSWDDRNLLVYRSDPYKCNSRLWLVSAADGQRREIAHEESTTCIERAAFSPDGGFVAYEVSPPYPFPESATSKVFVVPIQGGEPRLVYESPPWRDKTRPFSALADWTADGRYLAIKGIHVGKNALFLLPMKVGAASGSPIFVRIGDFEDAWSTLSGALIFRDLSSSYHIASIEADGKIGKWARMELDREPFPSTPSLSFDGGKIIYQARDLHSSGLDLIVKDLATDREGVVYQSDTDFLDCGYSAIRPLVFCTSEKIGGKTDLVSVSVDSGAVEEIATFPDQRWLLPHRQDERVFYFASDQGKGEADPKIRWDRITHKETVVADSEGVGESVAPSLDGRWILRQREGDLSFRPESGGDWKTLASGIENFHMLGSTPDGNWALYLASDPQGHQEILEAPFSGGEHRRVGKLPDNYPSPYGYLVFSPDGSKVLAIDSPPQTLWILENFEPKTSK